MTLFLIGIIEMLFSTLWTKVVTKTQVWSSGIVTLINVIIWYYVLAAIIDNISNWQLALLYALGCAVGTMIGTYYFQIKKKMARKKNLALRIKLPQKV